MPVRKLELEGIGHTGLVLAISRPFRWRAPVLEEIEAFIRSVKAGMVLGARLPSRPASWAIRGARCARRRAHPERKGRHWVP